MFKLIVVIFAAINLTEAVIDAPDEKCVYIAKLQLCNEFFVEEHLEWCYKNLVPYYDRVRKFYFTENYLQFCLLLYLPLLYLVVV